MIKPALFSLLSTAAVFGLAACDSDQDKDRASTNTVPTALEAPEVVPVPMPASGIQVTAADPSDHFAEVLKHLDVGGKMLHFEDHSSRRQTALDMGNWIIGVMEQDKSMTLPEGFDLEALVDATGMFESGASGRSVDRDGDAFLMRSYTHCPEGVTPWVKMVGETRPFRAPTILPDGTDVVIEGRVDGRYLPEMIMKMALATGQREPVMAWMQETVPTGMTYDQLLSTAYVEVIAGAELSDSLLSPVLPTVRGWYVELKTTPEGLNSVKPMMTQILGEAQPLGDYQGWMVPVPVIPGKDALTGQILLVDDETIIIVSSEKYLKDLQGSTSKLADHEAYQRGTDHFPKEGNLLLYVSPDVAPTIGKWFAMGAEMEDSEEGDAIMNAIKNLPVNLKDQPWTFCIAASPKGFSTSAEVPFIINSNTILTSYAFGAVPVLFIGARAWKKGSDRSACILNVRNVQQAVRAHQNMNMIKEGEKIDWDKIFGDDGFLPVKPVCPTHGAYKVLDKIPKPGNTVFTCPNEDHAPDNVDNW